MERPNDLPTGLPAICDEFELKYKTAQCLSHMRLPQEAIAIIESVPVKLRPSKMHLLFGQLNKARGATNAAMASYKEVLKEHQLALDVAEELLEMGVSGLEVNSLVVDATHMPQCEWLATWIEAHSYITARAWKGAAGMFKTLMNDSPIQNHHRLLVQIGKCYFYDGSYDLALRYLQRANKECPQVGGEGLILLANLLCRENKLSELEQLIAPSVDVKDYKPEHWFLLALRLYYCDHYERLDYYLERARGKSTFLDIEVSLLKATVCIALQKYDQALMELRSISQTAEHRFELYNKFVEIFIKKGKLIDAQCYASLARTNVGRTPRTLMLLAKCQEGDPAQYQEYKALLWRIYKMDETYLPVIDSLVELLVKKEKDYPEAERILRSQMAVQPNSWVATRLGDISMILGEHSNALDFYNMAVRMDPSNQKAVNALNNMSVEGYKRPVGCGDAGGDRNCSTASGKLPVGDVPFEVDFGVDVSGTTSHQDQSSSLVQNETLWDDAVEMNNN